MGLKDVRLDIWNAQSRIDDAVDDLQRAEETLSRLIDSDRVVILPCNFGDRLWWCYDDDDHGGAPTVEQSTPVKGFLIEPGGAVSATFDFICYDRIGGPDLFLTEAEALAERARRLEKRNEEGQ